MNYLDFFEKNGYLIIEKCISDELLDAYEKEWDKDNLDKRTQHGLLTGWDGHSSYLEHDSIKDILCNETINAVFMDLQKGMALHSSRTYGTSTEMPWHHDSVLPNNVAADNYIGVWVAIEDVAEDSGPFEFIPGSHKWDIDYSNVYTVEEIGSFEGDYGSVNLSEEIRQRGIPSIKFLAKRGDIIIWHGRLIHRGAQIQNKNVTRKALIGHYCNGYANIDAGDIAPSLTESLNAIKWEVGEPQGRLAQWKSGGYYFKS
jgi:ectoine hydroxylase-related dioxygenase (phytanoyl-CoA dioxygenase family)